MLLLVQVEHGGVYWTDDLQEEIYWSVTEGTGDSSVPEKFCSADIFKILEIKQSADLS